MINVAVMPINEEEDDESGRTGPAGTIGGDAAQDCVSENIESNTRRLQKTINQSAKGNMQNQMIPEEENQSFDRESALLEIGKPSDIVKLTNTKTAYLEFVEDYDELFQQFQSRLLENYK